MMGCKSKSVEYRDSESFWDNQLNNVDLLL